MKTPRIVPAAVVAGLAVAAALVTTNFIRAAEGAANVPSPGDIAGRRIIPAAPGCADLPWAAGGPVYAAPFAARGGTLDLVSFAGCADRPTPRMAVGVVLPGSAISVADVLIRTFGPVASEVSKAPSAAAAKAAADAARDAAELEAMFAVAVPVNPARVEAAKNAQGARGKDVYLGLCYACHQPDGRGLPGAFPMLAKSDFMAADRTRTIRIVLEGMEGPVTVNGQTLNSAMPAQKTALTDEQVADVLTYVFNAWENPGGAFTAKEVEVIRNENTAVKRE